MRGIAVHEAFALTVGQKSPFAPNPLGDETAGAIDSGRMKLHELHILEGESCTKDHGVAVPRTGVRRGTG